MNRVGAGAMSAGIVLALILGAVSGPHIIGLPAIAFCLGVATFLTIGGLERNWHTNMRNYRIALRLVAINLVAGSLLMVVVGLAIGAETPAGMGFLALAVVPVAAGIPAYSNALGIPAERMSLFALMSYVAALAVTPLLLGLIFENGSAWKPLLLTMLLGLIAPCGIGILMSGWVRRIPVRARRTVVISALLVAMAGLGGVLEPSGLTSAELGAPLLLVIGLSLLRAPIGGLIGLLLNGKSPIAPTFAEAALAGGFKNCALAGASAIAAGIPAAAVPGALGIVSEAALLGIVGLIGHRTIASNVTHSSTERLQP